MKTVYVDHIKNETYNSGNQNEHIAFNCTKYGDSRHRYTCRLRLTCFVPWKICACSTCTDRQCSWRCSAGKRNTFLLPQHQIPPWTEFAAQSSRLAPEQSKQERWWDKLIDFGLNNPVSDEDGIDDTIMDINLPLTIRSIFENLNDVAGKILHQDSEA